MNVMYLAKDTPKNLSKVDKSNSMSCLALIIWTSASQIGLTISQLQRMWEAVSGTLSHKAQLGEFFLLILNKKSFKAMASWKNLK